MRAVKVRHGFGRWRWLHHLACCGCGHVMKLLGADSRRAPTLPPGAVRCPVCEGTIGLGAPNEP